MQKHFCVICINHHLWILLMLSIWQSSHFGRPIEKNLDFVIKIKGMFVWKRLTQELDLFQTFLKVFWILSAILLRRIGAEVRWKKTRLHSGNISIWYNWFKLFGYLKSLYTLNFMISNLIYLSTQNSLIQVLKNAQLIKCY